MRKAVCLLKHFLSMDAKAMGSLRQQAAILQSWVPSAMYIALIWFPFILPAVSQSNFTGAMLEERRTTACLKLGIWKLSPATWIKLYPKWGKEIAQKLMRAKELIATPPSHVRSHHLHTQRCKGKGEGRKQTTPHTYPRQSQSCSFSLSLEELERSCLGCAATGYAGIARTIGNNTVGRKKPLFLINLPL